MRRWESITVDIATLASRCPIANGDGDENEIGQGCTECAEDTPDRAAFCDLIQSGGRHCIMPDFHLMFEVSPGWRGRVLRRVGKEEGRT